MYGAITGLRFEGSIMPKNPAREADCDLCMPTISMPGLEARLKETRPRHEGGAVADLMPVRFGQDAHNYGFTGKSDDGERLHWLV